MSEPPIKVNVITETIEPIPVYEDMELHKNSTFEIITDWLIIPRKMGIASMSQARHLRTYAQVNPPCSAEPSNAQGFKRELNDPNASSDLEKFQITLTVKHYQHDELKVMIRNGFITIVGKHGERDDGYSLVSRQFIRKYKIPDGVDLTKISSRFFDNGTMIISAPYIVQQGIEIPIVQNDQPPSKKVCKDENESQKKKISIKKE